VVAVSLADAHEVMVDRCGRAASPRVLTEGVEPTHAGSYWSFPFFGIYSDQWYAEEYRYRFVCVKDKGD
jgi:hypothetical protein